MSCKLSRRSLYSRIIDMNNSKLCLFADFLSAVSAGIKYRDFSFDTFDTETLRHGGS